MWEYAVVSLDPARGEPKGVENILKEHGAEGFELVTIITMVASKYAVFKKPV